MLRRRRAEITIREVPFRRPTCRRERLAALIEVADAAEANISGCVARRLEQPQGLSACEQHAFAFRRRVGELDLDHRPALDAVVVRMRVLDFAVDRRGHAPDARAQHETPRAAVELGAELDVARIFGDCS